MMSAWRLMRGTNGGTFRTPNVTAVFPAASRPLDKPATTDAPACMLSALALTQPDTLPLSEFASTKTQPPSTEVTRTVAPWFICVNTAEDASFSARISVGRNTLAF
jgi:hypothetical protein